jgi:hypothetical protein
MKLSLSKIKDKKRSSFSTEINPHKHWQILLWLVLFITIFLLILSLYLLMKIKNEDVFKIKNPEPESPTIIKEKTLLELTEYFQQKELKTDQIKNNPIFYSDPSF